MFLWDIQSRPALLSVISSLIAVAYGVEAIAGSQHPTVQLQSPLWLLSRY